MSLYEPHGILPFYESDADYTRIKEILSKVECHPFLFWVHPVNDRACQVACVSPDLPDSFAPWNHADTVGHFILVHNDAPESEVIQTAFACVLAFQEHELRERFFYEGAMVFSPHKTIEELKGDV